MKRNKSSAEAKGGRLQLREVLLVILLTIFVQFIEYSGWFAAIDGRVFNTWLKLKTPPDEAAFRDSIYLVKIDDAAYDACFASTSPLDPENLGAIVQSVAGAKDPPAVIGVDVFTETKALAPKYSDIVKQLAGRDESIVWISGVYPGATKYEAPNFIGWLWGKEDEFVVKPTAVLGLDPAELSMPEADINWGIPVFPLEEDLQVRAVSSCFAISADPTHSSVQILKKSWPRLIAEKYNRTVRDCKNGGERAYFNFKGRMPEEFALRELFECSDQGGQPPKKLLKKKDGSAFWNTLKDKIVLVGGTFESSRDFYFTPNGRLAGLEINGYAVRSELERGKFHEISQPAAVLLDLAVGIFTLWLVKREAFRKRVRRPKLRWLVRSHEMRLSLILSIAVWLLIVFAVWRFAGSYVMGVAGVVFGILFDSFIDIVRENPKPEDAKASR